MDIYDLISLLVRAKLSIPESCQEIRAELDTAINTFSGFRTVNGSGVVYEQEKEKPSEA